MNDSDFNDEEFKNSHETFDFWVTKNNFSLISQNKLLKVALGTTLSLAVFTDFLYDDNIISRWAYGAQQIKDKDFQIEKYDSRLNELRSRLYNEKQNELMIESLEKKNNIYSKENEELSSRLDNLDMGGLISFKKSCETAFDKALNRPSGSLNTSSLLSILGSCNPLYGEEIVVTPNRAANGLIMYSLTKSNAESNSNSVILIDNKNPTTNNSASYALSTPQTTKICVGGEIVSIQGKDLEIDSKYLDLKNCSFKDNPIFFKKPELTSTEMNYSVGNECRTIISEDGKSQSLANLLVESENHLDELNSGSLDFYFKPPGIKSKVEYHQEMQIFFDNIQSSYQCNQYGEIFDELNIKLDPPQKSLTYGSNKRNVYK
jgi:hypothetical protein